MCKFFVLRLESTLRRTQKASGFIEDKGFLVLEITPDTYENTIISDIPSEADGYMGLFSENKTKHPTINVFINEVHNILKSIYSPNVKLSDIAFAPFEMQVSEKVFNEMMYDTRFQYDFE